MARHGGPRIARLVGAEAGEKGAGWGETAKEDRLRNFSNIFDGKVN